MAAALRGLVTKIRIPCAAALRASRSSSSLPKGDLESALLLNNKIKSATSQDLLSSGDLIARHCDGTDEIIDQLMESHLKVARSVRNIALRCFCTGVVLEFISQTIEAYYYVKPESDLEERRLEEE